MSVGRDDLGLFALAVAAAVIVGPGAPVYWDSFGYVTQALSGHVGGLLLGRPTFVLTSHLLSLAVRALGASPFALEGILRHLWLLVAALAAPATARLARSLSLGRSASWWAGLVVALSPAFAHTSDAVLTDAPSMALTVIALALGAEAVRRLNATIALASGVFLGIAIGLREQAVFSVLPLGLLLWTAPPGVRRRLWLAACVGTVVSFGAPLGYVLGTQPGYPATITRWLHAMSDERAHHAWSLRDLGWYGLWVLSLGPLPVAMALVGWKSIRARPLLAVCLPSLLQLALLAAYQDIAFSPRYLLAALPGAIALPAGIALAHLVRTRRASVWVLASLVLPLAMGAWLLHTRQAPLIAALRALPTQLQRVPPDAAVVTGQLCPAVVYLRDLARADPTRWSGSTVPAWQQVCPGWRWPTDLPMTLDGVIAQGRTVVIDLRPVAWVGPRQQSALEQARAYAHRHEGDRRVVVW